MSVTLRSLPLFNNRTIAVCAVKQDNEGVVQHGMLDSIVDSRRPAELSSTVMSAGPMIGTCDSNRLSTTLAGGVSRCLKPLQILSGHADEVNAIRWDPSGSILASCSDDRSVLLWRLGMPTPVRRFRDHTEEIYTIRWSPTGPATHHPSAPLRLASASFDATVKLWDIEAGACAHTLQKHDKKV